MSKTLVALHTVARGDDAVVVGGHGNDHWIGQARESKPNRRISPFHLLQKILSAGWRTPGEAPIFVATDLAEALEPFQPTSEVFECDLVYLRKDRLVLSGGCGVAVFDSDGQAVWASGEDSIPPSEGWPEPPSMNPPPIDGRTPIGDKVYLANLPLKDGHTVVLTTAGLKGHLASKVLPTMFSRSSEEFESWAEAVCFGDDVDAGAIQVLAVV